MSKTYTGIELLEAIESGEIKEGTRFKDSYGINYIYEKDSGGELILYKQETYYTGNVPDYSLFVDNIFTVVENEDIDIQSIEEFKSDYMMSNVEYQIQDKINEVIRAVKQLDRQINE